MIPFLCCSFTGTDKYVSAGCLKSQSEEGKIIYCLLVLNCILVLAKGLGMTQEYRKLSVGWSLGVYHLPCVFFNWMFLWCWLLIFGMVVLGCSWILGASTQPSSKWTLTLMVGSGWELT